jgi:Ras-related protein Rab-28
MILSCCNQEFAKEYKQTVGCEFYQQSYHLPDDSIARLEIWDIGGQSIASKMIETYIHEANAVLLVYDITNFQSFLDLEDWL